MAFDTTLDARLRSLTIRDGPRDQSYLAAYPIFLDYFRSRITVRDVSETDANVGVFLVYAWMSPAQLDPISLRNFATARDAISRCRSRRATQLEIDVIRPFVGGSLIATSKFLHLLNPTDHAIWDRRVAWAAYRYQYPYQYNQAHRYIEYLNDLDSLVLPADVAQRIANVLGAVSEMRTKEFALFHLGISEQTE